MEGISFNTLDYIIMVILLLASAHGWYLGFIVSFFNAVAYVVAGIATKVYYEALAVYVTENTTLYESIKSVLLEKLEVNPMTEKIGDLNHGIESVSSEMFENLNLPGNIKNVLNTDVLSMDGIKNVEFNPQVMIAETITEFVVNALCMIAIFLMVLFAVKLLAKILNLVAKLPVLNEINRFGGFVCGLLKGVILIFVGFLMITPIITLDTFEWLKVLVDESILGLWIYNHNIFMWIIKEIFVA